MEDGVHVVRILNAKSLEESPLVAAWEDTLVQQLLAVDTSKQTQKFIEAFSFSQIFIFLPFSDVNQTMIVALKICAKISNVNEPAMNAELGQTAGFRTIALYANVQR